MAIFYRGAGVATHWHTNNAQLSGFTAASPGTHPTTDRLKIHIVNGTTASPFISLTRSFGVALQYALTAGRHWPTRLNPAYVYEVEINNPPPRGLELIDPVQELATALSKPLDTYCYQHDGTPAFLLGVVDPSGHGAELSAPIIQAPPGGGAHRPANLTIDLETLVRALRDAEILAVGNIPASCIRARFEVS